MVPCQPSALGSFRSTRASLPPPVGTSSPPRVGACFPTSVRRRPGGPRRASHPRARRMSADPLAKVRRQLRAQLRERVDARGLSAAPRTERRVRVREEALSLMRESGALLPQRDLARVVNEVSDEVVGFGPIEFLLRDPGVTEVMVNGPDDVYVEREGRIERAGDGLFEGEEAVLHLIERIVGPLGLRVDESSPWADARLPDGSRVHAIVPPLSLRGPVLTIRKFSPVPLVREDLVAQRQRRPAHAPVPRGVRPGPGEPGRLRRRRQRQDDAPRRPVRVHPRRGAPHHDRGRGRAAAREAARRSRSRRGRPTSRAGARSRCATSSATRCACGRTGSSSARSAAARPSTCSRR